MARDVQIRPRARGDLLEIWTFVAVNDANAADRLLDRIESIFVMLAAHALAGRARPELGVGLRSFPVGSYVVYYRHDEAMIDIVRVLSGFLDIADDDFV